MFASRVGKAQIDSAAARARAGDSRSRQLDIARRGAVSRWAEDGRVLTSSGLLLQRKCA